MFIWKWEAHVKASNDAKEEDYWIHPQNGKFVLAEKKFFHQVGKVTAAAFHKSTGFLCIGLSTGIFSLVELPDFNILQSMR